MIALWTLPAAAQNTRGSFELTGIGGGYFGRQVFLGAQTKVDASTAFEYGLHLGYNLTEDIGFEAAWTRAKPDLNASPVGAVGVPVRIGTLTSDSYQINSLFYVGESYASFYVILGVGATTLSPEIFSAFARSSTRISFGAGMGGKFWLGRNFGLRVEGKWNWVATSVTTNAGIWCDSAGVCYAFSTNFYNYPELSGGIVFRF